MFHLTLFSNAEARLMPNGGTSLTLFGSTTLRGPTVAQRATRLAQGQPSGRSLWDRLIGRDQMMLLTVFGYTEIALPGLVEEFAALRELAARNEPSREQLRSLCQALRVRESAGLEMTTITLFGHCEIGRPANKRELAAIERARKVGDIDSVTGSALERLVGQSEPAVIGGLAAVALG